jgi:two-component system CheB/CheR fusion protein
MQPEQGQRDFSILNPLPLGLFVLDREGRFLYLNAIAQRFFQEVCHRPPAELLGQVIWEKCPEVADSAFTKEHHEALAEQRAFELEVFYPTLKRWFVLLASLDGEQHCFYFRDTTEQRRVERELRVQIEHLAEADHGKVEFLVHLAHEVRNTLAVLQNSFYLARQGREATERAATAGEASIAELSSLMDDLLKLSELMLGRVEPHKEQVDLTPLVAQAAEGIIALPQGRGRSFTVGLPSEPLWVMADPEHLRKAVFHLLDNAVGQTRPGDHVWLSAETQDGRVVLRVEDDGVGIEPEALPHIFELFLSGNRTTERAQARLRTGLALVRYLIELQGGEVEVSSDGPGSGSEFVVRLPQAPTALAEPAAAAVRAAPGKVQVLVVDNNAQTAESLAWLLNLWGYEPRVVYDGPAALREAGAWRPQVVLLDIGMPGMDGHEVARLLHQQLGPNTPILIAVTGYGQDEDRQRAREAGFDYFVVKPAPPEDLRELLDAAVVEARHGLAEPPS